MLALSLQSKTFITHSAEDRNYTMKYCDPREANNKCYTREFQSGICLRTLVRVIPLRLECYNLLVSAATGESFFSSIFLSAQENRHNIYDIKLHNTNNMYYVKLVI